MKAKIVSELKAKGYRITPQRKLIIAELVAANKALSAAEIYDSLRIECPQIGLDTIYRNINVLADMGVLMPISGVGKDSIKYELNCMHHHHHILCVDCGEIQCLDICPIDDNVANIIADKGYELLTHNIELYGLCEKCRKIRGPQHE